MLVKIAPYKMVTSSPFVMFSRSPFKIALWETVMDIPEAKRIIVFK
jgi:hypothetical protein